jgi:predicted Kef-type K+ transport protein
MSNELLEVNPAFYSESLKLRVHPLFPFLMNPIFIDSISHGFVCTAGLECNLRDPDKMLAVFTVHKASPSVHGRYPKLLEKG